MALPRYQTLEELPTPNGILLPGAIIDFEGSPGPHLYPLNPEARARMEEWYLEWYEFDQSLPDGTKIKVRHQPHLQFRQMHSEPATVHQPVVISSSSPRSPKGQSLAEVNAPGMGKKAFDQRPGPAESSNIRKEFLEPLNEEEGAQMALVAEPPPLDPSIPGATIKSSKR